MKRFSATTLAVLLVLVLVISMSDKAEAANCCSIFNTKCCCRNKAGQQVGVKINIFNGLQFTADGGT
ncbi:unnamed protein product, partial [Adineta ricciae]